MTAVLSLALIIAQDRKDFVEKIPGTLVEFKMVAVPDGEIAIEGKRRPVKGIWIGETEVTWDAFDVWAFRMDLTPEQNAQDFDAENRPSRPYGAPDRGFGHAGFAALGMTHAGAQRFCQWLSEKTGRKYRLPTEAEWEYAARAGADKEPDNIEDHAWFWDNSDSQAKKAKSLKPNAWGIYDTLGNTSEWCDPSVGKEPVVRGGNFLSKRPDVTFSSRMAYDPSWQLRDAQQPKSSWWLSDGEFIGMRLVCEG
ncbi:MAG: SUMF1/EgtB/PvdO family nonheme iron enzyme [Fimbriimonadaceae bacterium]